MSFNQNDNNQTIHLGNYEEFFILYLDNELSEEQVKMVDEFLITHPDLQAEFEILLGTKLPAEDFSFDKHELLAENMKVSSVDEELLLYIDNELTTDQKKRIELEIFANKDYHFQHQLLLKTKLEPSEQIVYPNKEELYHRTERRIVAFRPWMRIAAAVVVIATAGIVYFNSQSASDAAAAEQNKLANIKPVTVPVVKEQNRKPELNSNHNVEGQIALKGTAKKQSPSLSNPTKKDKVEVKEQSSDANMAINTTNQPQADPTPQRPVVRKINFDGFDKGITETTAIVNTANVTSSVVPRPTFADASDNSSTADNRKGSVKGFLRQATRVIEKRTGIDPTNQNGELLIGAVALKLK
jgi:hypothetical protein